MTTTSALIATYNQELYIAEAVLSLAEQVDEIIVVDDSSTDGTGDAIRNLRLPALRYVRNERRLGVSRSFNCAVSLATNDVLLIQGGDDRSLPDRAQQQVAALEDPDVSLVHSLPIVINGSGQRLPPDLAAEFAADPAASMVLDFLFFEANFICAPSVAVRRADYTRLGGFPGGIDLLQDYALWLRLATVGDFLRLDSPVVEYRKHGDNLSREYVGIDAPKHRRFAAEGEFVRNEFLETCTELVLVRLAVAAGLDGAMFSDLERTSRIAMLQLSHKDKLLNRRGLAHLFKIAGKDNADELLAAMGLTTRDLSRFATLADHENLEDVSRALSVVNRLDARKAQ